MNFCSVRGCFSSICSSLAGVTAFTVSVLLSLSVADLQASEFVSLLEKKQPRERVTQSSPKDSKSEHSTEALPDGDSYSLAPMVQDGDYAYFLTVADAPTTQQFNGEWKTVDENYFGSDGGKIVVIEESTETDPNTVRVTVQVTAIDSNGNEEPWVSEAHAGSGLTSLRLDVGSDAAGNNQVRPETPFTLLDSGVWLYDSAGNNVGDIEIDDTSDGNGLSGVAIVGYEDESDIAGADIATMVMYWFIEVESNDTGFEVTPGQSGAWYDPSHNGEGYILQVISPSEALVFWFTYDTSGNQYWMIGTGQIDGSRIIFDNLQYTKGGKFGPNFDPDDVQRIHWGTVELNFSGCNAAKATYQGPPAFGSGTLNVERLSGIWGVDCEGDSSGVNGTGTGYLAPGFTGSWFDPSHNGEGFTVEVLDEKSALIYWFTYDTNGNQAWMMILGEIQGASIFSGEVYQPSGPSFGPAFDTDDLVLREWGAAVFSFAGCNGHGGSMRYLPPSDFGVESTQLLYRLVSIESVGCRFLSGTYDISGKMTVAENIFIDGDVNDPNVEEIPNDLDSESAQQLVPPARVAGFVTSEATGVNGDRFKNENDEWDIYILPMQEGEGLSLTVSDWNPNDPELVDVDLYLIDVNDTENVLDSSLTTNEQELVIAPHAGNFFVFVNGYSGKSNYLLQSGQSGQVASSDLDVTTNFVPDQVIAALLENSALQSDQEAADSLSRVAATEAKIGLQRLSDNASGEILYEIASPGLPTLKPHPLTTAGYGTITPEQWQVIRTVKSLSANSDFRWAAPNYQQSLQEMPNDPGFPYQWHYPILRLPQAWDITRGDSEVIVAVLDSGIYDHADLAANVDYALGYDFVWNPYGAGDGDGIDADARDPGKKYPSQRAYSSHGTHVAGTIGARTNNGVGVAGVNWNVTMMPVRVCGVDRSCDCWQQGNGLRWAGRLANDSGTLPQEAAQVVNMSLGGSSPCPGHQDLINQLAAKGIIVVAAAGNDGNSVPNFPASFGNVFSVSATTAADQLAWYSSFGTNVDLAAPGGDQNTDLNGDGYVDGVLSNRMYVDVGSATIQTGYEFAQGTSMASPHVTGVAALMKSVYPDIGPNEFNTALASGSMTVDLAANGPTTKDPSFGYGRIDAQKAVQWAVTAEQGQQTSAFMTSSAAALDFESELLSIDVILSKAGSGSLAVSEVGWTESWMSVASVNLDQNGFGRYRVSANRNGLVDGQYSGWIAFDASDGSRLWISVFMRVGKSVSGNAGYVYALFLDQWTIDNARQWDGEQESDHFKVRADNLPPGGYYLMVSTDLDNDFVVCDDGELCEVYPSNSTIKPIEISNSNVQLGSFVMSFPTPALKTSGHAVVNVANALEGGSAETIAPIKLTGNRVRGVELATED